MILKFEFATNALTANTYAMDHLQDGHIVKFDVSYMSDKAFEIVVEDSNNDYGRKYPYTIRFNVKHANDGSLTIKPIVSKSFTRDFGRFGQEALVTKFQKRLLAKMAVRW